MIIAVWLFIFMLVWLITLGLSFVGGLAYSQYKKARLQPKPPSEEEKRAAERNRREFENFMNYSGMPQEVISDE